MMSAGTRSVAALLLSVALLWTANGLFGTLLGVRMVGEGFPTFVIGLVTSAYFLGQFIGAIFCGRIIERVGHVRSFAAFASLISACAVAHPILVDPVAWGVLRLLTGICIAGVLMVAESWLNSATSNEGRGSMLSIYTGVVYVGLAGGQQLLNVDDPVSFVLYCVASILFSLALVPLTLARSAASGEVTPSAFSFRELVAISPLGVVASFASGIVLGCIMGLGPIFGSQVGLSLSEVATFMTAIIFGGVVIQYPIGKASDYLDRRTVIAFTLTAAGGLAILMVVSIEVGFLAMLATAALFGGLTFALYPLALSHANDFIDPSDLVPAAAGLLMAGGFGSAIGPMIATATMEVIGPSGLFVFAAAVCLASGAFAFYRMTQRPAPTSEEQGPYVAMGRTTTAMLELDPRAELEEDLQYDLPFDDPLAVAAEEAEPSG